MLEKLESIEKRYIELANKISEPEVIARQDEWRKLTKELASLEDIVFCFREYKSFKRNKRNKEMLNEVSDDDEMEELIKTRNLSLKKRKSNLRKN